MSSQSRSSGSIAEQPELNQAPSPNEQPIKEQAKSEEEKDFDSNNMQQKLEKRIKKINETLYQKMWAHSIGSVIKIFSQKKKTTTNIKMGSQFIIDSQLVKYVKNSMEAQLEQNEGKQQKIQSNLKSTIIKGILKQFQKEDYNGQIDLLMQDPQQFDLHQEILNHVSKLKQQDQYSWYIENFSETLSQVNDNENFLFVFQTKEDIQLAQSEIPKYLAQIIKIALGTQELYLEKLIRCNVLSQIYYGNLSKERIEQMLKKPRTMFYYVINSNITKQQFIEQFRCAKPIIHRLFSQLDVVMNVIGYNPISPSELKKQKQMKKQREAQMKQFQQKIRDEMQQQLREREAQMEKKQREREVKREAQMQIMKGQLELLMKGKNS